MQGRLDGQLAGGPAPIGRLALPAGSGTPSIPTPKPPGRAGLGPLLDTGRSVPSAGHASPGPPGSSAQTCAAPRGRAPPASDAGVLGGGGRVGWRQGAGPSSGGWIITVAVIY